MNYSDSKTEKLPVSTITYALNSRLSTMMFLQYFVLGATVPILSLYLTGYLNLSGTQTGTILSMSAVAAVVSPLGGAFLADRFIGATFLYGICHVLAGMLMGFLSFQTRFEMFLIFYLIYMLVFGSTNSLSNAIVFHHLPDSAKRFGGIRMWGTIGWIAVAWIFGFFWLRSSGDILISRLPDALKLSALSSISLGIYAFTLPPTHIKRAPRKRIFPIESFRVIAHPDIIILSSISFLVALVERFYYFGTAPFLRQTGFHESNIMPAMSIGQIPEVFAMSLLGFFLMRLGMKRVLAIGVLMEFGRFAAFSLGFHPLVIFMGISFHGIAFTFFFATAFIYLDQHCNRESRTGVHQLFGIINSGLGSFCGSLLAGKTLDIFKFSGSDQVNYLFFWAVPAAISLIALLVILLLFKDLPKRESSNHRYL